MRPWWLLLGCMMMIPYMGTYTYQRYRPSVDWEQSAGGLVVYMEHNGIGRMVDFETYAMGVMGAVLEPDAHDEMLKTMAVVLRTYLSYMAVNGNYVDSTQLKLPWLSAYDRRRKGMDDERMVNAIRDTEGSVILYEDKAILPLYYKMSNGKTRQFTDVWKGELEYLTSVESLWDKSSPDFIQKFKISKSQWQKAWDFHGDSSGQWTASHMQIVEKDNSGYVKQIQIGTELYSGEEICHRLGLASACFEYTVKKHHVEFICYGEGHGVGLSLFGANAMAKEGKTWQEIILWYFPGTSV